MYEGAQYPENSLAFHGPVSEAAASHSHTELVSGKSYLKAERSRPHTPLRFPPIFPTHTAGPIGKFFSLQKCIFLIKGEAEFGLENKLIFAVSCGEKRERSTRNVY